MDYENTNRTLNEDQLNDATEDYEESFIAKFDPQSVILDLLAEYDSLDKEYCRECLVRLGINKNALSEV